MIEDIAPLVDLAALDERAVADSGSRSTAVSKQPLASSIRHAPTPAAPAYSVSLAATTTY